MTECWCTHHSPFPRCLSSLRRALTQGQCSPVKAYKYYFCTYPFSWMFLRSKGNKCAYRYSQRTIQNNFSEQSHQILVSYKWSAGGTGPVKIKSMGRKQTNEILLWKGNAQTRCYTHTYMCRHGQSTRRQSLSISGICVSGTLNKPLPTVSHTHQLMCNTKETVQLRSLWDQMPCGTQTALLKCFSENHACVSVPLPKKKGRL